MPGTIPAARQHLIDDIARRSRSLRGTRLPVSLTDFVQTYYRGVDEDDLRTADAGAFAAAAAGHLRFGATRRPGQALVRVFNPTPAADGWDSPHTCVQLVIEDMPFLVDSLAMVLNECGLAIQLMVHPVLRTQRDGRGRLARIADSDAASGRAESWQHMAVRRTTDPARLAEIERKIRVMLDDVRVAVEDWPATRSRALEIARSLLARQTAVPRAEAAEASEFLEWLTDNHFTFLGYREYRLERGRSADRLVPVAKSGLGLLRTGQGRPRPQPTLLKGEIRRRAREPVLLVVTKANSVSTVHRATYLDYVGVKTFDSRGRIVGERRFIGLFTSSTYSTSPREIPLLRHKVQRVIDHIGVSSVSHDGKALMHVLESHPRDELFQASVPELLRTCRGIVNLYERRRVRLFARRDPYQRFFSCLLFVPRDRYSTQARERIERILREEFAGVALESQVQISESALARLQTLVRTDPERDVTADIQRIERRIAEALRTWADQLREELHAQLPDDQAVPLGERFGSAFPVAYQEDVTPADAIGDIQELQALPPTAPALGLQLRRGDPSRKSLHLRLYRRGEPIAMSDMLPLLENFDLRILNERPYRIAAEAGDSLWIQDLEVMHAGGRELDPNQVGGRFEEAFFAVRDGLAESDGFNRLVLAAGLTWRQALVLRAVCRYLLQTGLPFSQRYMESVLARLPELAARLVWTFEARFDPALKAPTRASQLRSLARDIDEGLEKVTSPDDDRILRSFRAVILAALRTNHYQRDPAGRPKQYLSFKLDPKSLPELPKPRPMFEIWVYSPRVEGVHLRMGKVARGGIRWSDRREDFRTEVLGLMKAQNVKNTLIVPVGAKGGFVPKQMPRGSREEVQREGTECYRIFIRALLDLSDNVQGKTVVPPAQTVRYDADDPYLVVAADKGTATFSDIANALSAEYGFWLGDAFASGGSAGYDHKKMGITAKGAWECVRRHFRELGLDTQSQDFTVAGIGDMAGDVFGNGLLLSPHIRLLAAFNHQHIFLDPEPDTARSLRERGRLFNLPRSTWSDYDSRLISKGGGVFARDAKEIALSPQARTLLGIDAAKAPPNDVIRAILRLPVDLLWNGGIGTYVKSNEETHAEIGDRSNDAVRIDGRELRCRVVGEGGNLGLSQRGRIEYAIAGGRINTDFIDNSGGVNCSDVEVNLKILFAPLMESGKLTRPARNRLLARMTNEVGELVLRNNYLQSLAISGLQARAVERIFELGHVIRALERAGTLDRTLEALPTDDEILERHRKGLGLTRPELAMLLSYSKIWLSGKLIESDVAEDSFLGGELTRYFPRPVQRRYPRAILSHQLRREIIVTATTNSLVNRMGPVFAIRTQEDTGADIGSIARAFAIAREITGMRELWADIEALDDRVPTSLQYDMGHETTRLLRPLSYWVLRNLGPDLDIERAVSRLKPGIRELTGDLPELIEGLEVERYDRALQRFSVEGVPTRVARRVASLAAIHSGVDIVEVALARHAPIAHAARVYFGLGAAIGLDWIRGEIERLVVEGHWQALARGTLREDAYSLQRRLCDRILARGGRRDPSAAIRAWLADRGGAADSLSRAVQEMRSIGSSDFPTLSVALQAVRRLAER